MTATESSAGPARWSELFARPHRGAVVVLAGGVAMYATNIYLTASLLPSAVAEIGGAQFYAWTTTAFMIASVISSMFVRRVLAQRGAFGAYLLALSAFGIGSVIATVAPTMPLLLAGRVVQGLGGGLITGLGFAVIRSVVPRALWGRSVGLVSSMWGVGNITGPVIGGLFAEFGLWRWAFGLLVVLSIALILVAKSSLPATERNRSSEQIPFASLGALTIAVTAVSLSGVVDDWILSAVLLAVGAIAIVGFVGADRRSHPGVLPAITFEKQSPLRWIYLTIAFLAIGSTVETFVPMFGQQLGGMSPLGAGLLGAALSWGWSLGSIASSSIDSPRLQRIARIVGPGILAAGLVAYGLLQESDPGAIGIALWFVVTFIAGLGIGVAFVHSVTAAMSSTDDPQLATQASAGANSVQLISNAVGASIAGVLVNLSPSDPAHRPAQVMSIGLGIIAAFGVGAAMLSTRRARQAPPADERL